MTFYKILLLGTLLIPIFSIAQTLENSELKGKFIASENYIEFETNKIKLSGSTLSKVQRPKYYDDDNDFIILSNNDFISLVSFKYKLDETSKINSINELYIFKNQDSAKTIKKFSKGKIKEDDIVYKYNAAFNDLIGFNGETVKSLYWSNQEKYREEERQRQKEKEEIEKMYIEKTGLLSYVGTYDVTISFYERQKLAVPYKGKLYLSSSGFSLITNLPTDNTLRGNHSREGYLIKNIREEGGFFGKLSKGFGKEFVLTINKDKTAGGLTRTYGSSTVSISFNLNNFQKE
jgi:hypothetical protein